MNNFSNQYSIIKNIGKGSFGSVYKIKRYSDEKTYALKKILLSANKDQYSLNCLLNEVKILTGHDSNYLLKCYNVYVSDGYLNIVTDYAKYCDLKEYIKIYKNKNKKMAEYLIWDIFIQCCLGLDYLHKYNIIHRDIKTANILVDSQHRIWLGDFGISKILQSAPSTFTQIGTPMYTSPEMVKHQKYNQKIDVWSLGCILYELATFRHPFHANNIHSLNYKIISGSFDQIKGYSEDLKNMIALLLQTNVSRRPSIKQIINSDIFKQKNSEAGYILDNEYKSNVYDNINRYISLPKYNSDWERVLNSFNRKHLEEHIKTRVPKISKFSQSPSSRYYPRGNSAMERYRPRSRLDPINILPPPPPPSAPSGQNINVPTDFLPSIPPTINRKYEEVKNIPSKNILPIVQKVSSENVQIPVSNNPISYKPSHKPLHKPNQNSQDIDIHDYLPPVKEPSQRYPEYGYRRDVAPTKIPWAEHF